MAGSGGKAQWQGVEARTGSEAGTGKVKGVDNEQRSGTGQTAGGEVDSKERPELGFGAVLGEHGLDRVLERKVESLCGEVADDVGGVASPERKETLLGADAHEAVDDALVPRDLPGLDPGV